MPRSQAARSVREQAAEFDWPPVSRPPRSPSRAAGRRTGTAHFRRRRRQLLTDGLLGLALAIALISATAGLGVLFLLLAAIVAVLLPWAVLDRRRRSGRRVSRSPARRR